MPAGLADIKISQFILDDRDEEVIGAERLAQLRERGAHDMLGILVPTETLERNAVVDASLRPKQGADPLRRILRCHEIAQHALRLLIAALPHVTPAQRVAETEQQRVVVRVDAGTDAIGGGIFASGVQNAHSKFVIAGARPMRLKCQVRVLHQAGTRQVISCVQAALRFIETVGLHEHRGQLVLSLERGSAVLALSCVQRIECLRTVLLSVRVVGQAEIRGAEGKLDRRLGLWIVCKAPIEMVGGAREYVAHGRIVCTAGAARVRGPQQIIREEAIDRLRPSGRVRSLQSGSLLSQIKRRTDSKA